MWLVYVSEESVDLPNNPSWAQLRDHIPDLSKSSHNATSSCCREADQFTHGHHELSLPSITRDTGAAIATSMKQRRNNVLWMGCR